VPLVLRLPNAQHAGTRVKGQVRSLDIAATVLDVLGTPTSLATSGASLLPLLADPPEPRDRPSFAIADISGDVSGFPIDGRRLSLRTKGHKLIFSSSHWLDTTRVNEREEFYDLARDSDELDDLRANAQVPSLPFADMHEDLGRWREATADLDLEAPKSADVIEQLRKLGYL
jgi:arylsulfatase A-like enzyme